MKIAAIVISCFVFLVVPQCGWAGDCSPLQISLTKSYQLVSADKDVCGLRLNLPVGENRNIYGLDLGFWGDAVESKGIMLNLIGNMRTFSHYQEDVSVTKGIEIGGLLNIQFLASMKGLQLASLANINIGNIDGIQIAGLFNIGWVRGIQIAGLYNGSGDARGIQISGLCNRAQSVRGIQIGLINFTTELSSVRGIQIGLINATKELFGLQIGLVNYVRESPVPILPIINLKF